MAQITGTVFNRDGSTAAGVRVTGLAAGPAGAAVGPAATDARGRFVLSWDAPAGGLATLSVEGVVKRENVRAGDDVPVRL